MKKFAVVLAGCGVYDGAEIHEATLTMLAIMKHGATYELFAPNIPQYHVVNHLTGQPMNETRNVLVESARIARGKIRPLDAYMSMDFDGLIFPGGFGVAKNLCDFAFKGAEMKVNDVVMDAILCTRDMKKPIGLLCIAPVLAAKVLKNARVTIGQDAETAEAIEKMGGIHELTTHGEITFDEKNHLFTTPCYMLDASILQIEQGAMNLVGAMMKYRK